MSAADLIARLERTRQCGTDRWRAICPAHKSKHRTQSLAIREMSDGTVLIKCFAGCGAVDVVAAVGMELRDLFPPRYVAPVENEESRPRGPQGRIHWHAIRQAVQTLNQECLIVAIAAGDVASGRTVSTEDAGRVALAAERIRGAIEACV